MKHLTPIPTHSRDRLKKEQETGIGYQIVSVHLKDGRRFDQVVLSEGYIIAVRDYKDVPFACEDVECVELNHKRWNFREYSDARTKTMAAES